MAAGPKRPSLVAIVGPTASGKSDLAMKIAKQFNGEVICADSRTIYEGMDIGTAKPSVADQNKVPHWGLDLVEPGESFSAAKFKQYADAKILDIQNRGKLPILVGGTGLYIDGVLYNFSFIATKKRRWLYAWRSVNSLQKTIQKRGWEMPANSQNKRHLTRTIERSGSLGSRKTELPADVLLIGLMPPDQVLKERINSRAETMFKQGIINETKTLLDRYDKKALSQTGGIIYGITQRLIKQEITNQQALELFKTADWQYARRQRTWFKRNPHIKWFKAPEPAYNAVKNALLNT